MYGWMDGMDGFWSGLDSFKYFCVSGEDKNKEEKKGTRRWCGQ